MKSLILEDIRCFHRQQISPVKPITILVGENSTGKTTFLASYRIAWDLCHANWQINFNEEPFMLGTYDHIASYRGGNTLRAENFYIGAQVKINRDIRKGSSFQDIATVIGKFASDASQPILRNWTFDTGKYLLSLNLEQQNNKAEVEIKTPNGFARYSVSRLFSYPMGIPEFFSFLQYFAHERGRSRFVKKLTRSYSPSDEEWTKMIELGLHLSSQFGSRPYAIAPIRTRPQMTYDTVKDFPTPEGSHIPMTLARIRASDPEKWNLIKKSVNGYGNASGLFDDVEVKRLGNSDSDPFQLRVKISGPPFNLVFVGYGVSQVLPIIVDAIEKPEGTTFLLQQPEVHLHPRAQAELGSFLGYIAKKSNKKFIIETHSDYLLDRIRMDIRNKTGLTNDDVNILYFERDKYGVTITPIEIDKQGNIINPPKGYRGFFFEEERRLLIGK